MNRGEYSLGSLIPSSPLRGRKIATFELPPSPSRGTITTRAKHPPFPRRQSITDRLKSALHAQPLTTSSSHSGPRFLTIITVGSVVLLFLILLSLPPPAEAISSSELAQISKLFSEFKAEFKEELMQSQSDFKTELKADMIQSQNEYRELLKKDLGFYPTVTAGIALFTGAFTVGVAQISNEVMRSKVDDTVNRFVESKDGLKKELEANTKSKALGSSIAGGFIAVSLMLFVLSVPGIESIKAGIFEHVPMSR